MNTLLLNCRPGAVFDATNKERRRAYFNFLKYSSWGRSPYQFILEPGFEDIPTLCRHRLCEFYVAKEFGKDTPKRHKDSNKLTVINLPQKAHH